MKFHWFFSLLILSLVVSCGKGENKNNKKSSDRLTRPELNFKSGNCSEEVVSDYNIVASKIAKVSRSIELNRGRLNDNPNLVKELKLSANIAQNELDKFLGKYPGVNCRALKSFSDSINEDLSVEISERKLLDAKKSLEEIQKL